MNYIHLGCGYRLHRLDSSELECELARVKAELGKMEGERIERRYRELMEG